LASFDQVTINQKAMDTTTNSVSRLISRLVTTKLTSEEVEELESWKRAAIGNRLLVESFADETIRNKRLTEYHLADANSLWSNLRSRAADESGFELDQKPEPLKPVTPIQKALMAITILLGFFFVMAIIYMTISNVKNHRFPVKSIPQRNFHF
jgi:hypothetical protein